MWYNDYKPTKPRAAKGGIKAQSKRGAFGESWWAKRWIETLENFDIGARLSRGRSYARKGQVLDIDIQKGKVTAKVQGSRPQPYKITIEIKQLSASDWNKLAKVLSQQAIFTAKLLAGEMPEEIEDAFKFAKLSLFPSASKELSTECACPDWSNPCKHIAAVYYLLGEEFDRDPFLLFKLRGLDREELLDELSAAEPIQVTETIIPEEPLPQEADLFWKQAALPPDFFGEVHAPPVNAALPKRLGNFPFWRGESPFQETMESFYEQTKQRDVM